MGRTGPPDYQLWFMTCIREEEDRITTGMSHRTACGWSQVCIDSGPVRPGGPVPFAVTRSHTRSLLLIHVFGCRLLFCFPLTLQCIALDGSVCHPSMAEQNQSSFLYPVTFILLQYFPYCISFLFVSCRVSPMPVSNIAITFVI